MERKHHHGKLLQVSCRGEGASIDQRKLRWNAATTCNLHMGTTVMHSVSNCYILGVCGDDGCMCMMNVAVSGTSTLPCTQQYVNVPHCKRTCLHGSQWWHLKQVLKLLLDGLNTV